MGNITTQDVIGFAINPFVYGTTKAIGAGANYALKQSGLINMPNMSMPTLPSPDMPTVPQVDMSAGGGAGGGGGPVNQLTDTPTYGWDGIKNSTNPGAQIPLVYGEHRVGGVILAVNKEALANGDEVLNILIAMAEGEVESISQVELNGNLAENFYGVVIQTAKGLSTQAAMPYFNDVVTSYDLEARITTGGYIYTSRSNAIQGARLHVAFPGGLFAIEDRTDTTNYLLDLGDRATGINDEIAGKNWYIVDIQAEIDRLITLQEPGWEGNVEYWKGVITGVNSEIRTLSGSLQSITQQQSTVSRTMNRDAHISTTVIFAIEYRRNGETAWKLHSTQSVTANSKTAVRRTFKVDNLPAGRYDLRIRRTTPDPRSFLINDDAHLTAVEEVVYDDLAYPHTALLAVRAVATDQLSGGMPNVTAVVKGRKVKTWSGSAWVTAWSSNPAWILLDIMTNARFGMGAWINENEIDLESFKTAALWCDELVSDGVGGQEARCRWDGVIEGCPQPWELLQQICSTFGGVLLYSGGLYRLRVEKPESAAQTIGMGDIISGSARFGYHSSDKIINCLDAQYSDAYENWRQQIIPFEAKEVYQNGEPRRARAVSLTGVTRRSQAIREGNIQMNRARLVRRTLDFTIGASFMAAEVFDVINVSHDLPQWGYSGRVLRSAGRKVHLDQTLTLPTGTVYKLRIIHLDGTEEEKTVITLGEGALLKEDGSFLLKEEGSRILRESGGGYTSDWVIADSGWAAAPEEGASWVLGPVGQMYKQFRIIEISRAGNDLLRQVKTVEYNPAVWSLDAIALPSQPVTLLPDPAGAPDPVEGLAASERLYYTRAGEMGVAIDITWRKPAQTSGVAYLYDHADVYLSRDFGATWEPQGSSSGESYSILDVLEGRTYIIAVTAVGRLGGRRRTAEEPQVSIAVVGKSKPPAAPTGFAGVQNGGDILLSWTAVDEPDVAGYVLREGLTWDASLPVAAMEPGTSRIVPISVNATYRFWIKAVDTTGHLSSAVMCQVTAAGLDYNAVIEQKEEDSNFPGTKQDFVYISELAGIINPSALTDADCPTRDGTDATLGPLTGEPSATHIYTTGAFDTGAVMASRVSLLLQASVSDSSASDITYPNRSDVTHPEQSALFVPADFTMLAEINRSDDGAAWTGWSELTPGVYTARYYKLRLTFTASITARVLVTGLRVVVDVPDIEFKAAGFAVGVGGSTLTYASYDARAFRSTPMVFVTPVASGFALPVVSSKTASSCVITLYDAAGASISGSVDVSVDGF